MMNDSKEVIIVLLWLITAITIVDYTSYFQEGWKPTMLIWHILIKSYYMRIIMRDLFSIKIPFRLISIPTA